LEDNKKELSTIKDKYEVFFKIQAIMANKEREYIQTMHGLKKNMLKQI
jgi:hypothetical protein